MIFTIFLQYFYNSPYRYILTFINPITKWIEAEAMAEITAKNVAQAYVNVWITRWVSHFM